MEHKAGGYVVLAPIKGKRREMTVEITESGKNYTNEVLKPLYKREAKVYKLLADEDKNVVEMLEKIVSLMREN